MKLENDSVQFRPLTISRPGNDLKPLKLGVMLYFLLLIFEGGLRKWVLPGLATPLLIARDPVALFLIFRSVKNGIFPKNGLVTAAIGLTAFSILTAMVFGHRNIYVAIYGARIMMLHFPVIFIIGRVLNQSDVIKIGRLVILFAIPMAVLIAMQFYSPQSAWVNRGVGGDVEGAGFTGALGFMRPPGTFSFTNGTTLFFSLTGVYVLFFWLNPHYVKRWILIGATVSLLAAIPLSISRALLFQLCGSAFFVAIAIARKPKYLGKMVFAAVGVSVVLLFLQNYSFFQTATAAFTYRFEGANETEGGLQGVIGDRYIGGMISSITKFSDLEFFGGGLGLGTSVGAMLLSGKTGLQLSEDEWGRVIGELGMLMGLIIIFIRLSFSFKLAKASYDKLKTGNLLPWILLSFVLTTVPQGQWAQPTALGFGVLIGGLTIASMKTRLTSIKRKRVEKQNILSHQLR